MIPKLSTRTPIVDAMERELYESRPSGWDIERRRVNLCKKMEQQNRRLKAWNMRREEARKDDEGMWIDCNGDYIDILNDL